MDLPGTTNAHVLIVDDEPSIRDLLVRLLSKSGYTVSVAETGEAALSALALEPFDAVMVDKNLPGMTGLDVLRAIEEKHPRTVTIMMTAFPNAEAEADARSLGARGFVVKPFAIRDVLRTVADALRPR